MFETIGIKSIPKMQITVFQLFKNHSILFLFSNCYYILKMRIQNTTRCTFNQKSIIFSS